MASSSSSVVFEEIKSRIISGDMQPGEHLIEAKLAELFSISRTPIREALRRLGEAGLVVFSRHQGVRVRKWTRDEILDSYEIRGAMEAIAAKRAALNLSQLQLERLKVLHDGMCRMVDSEDIDIENITELNAEFHRIIVQSTNSMRLMSTLKNVVEIPLVRRTFARYTKSQLSRSMAHHQELISAFEKKDGEWASSVMKCHIRAASYIIME